MMAELDLPEIRTATELPGLRFGDTVQDIKDSFTAVKEFVEAIQTGGGENPSVGGLPATMLFTSLNGLVSDANLDMESDVFGTDNTEAMQALLDQATATNAIWIIVDGRYSITQIKAKSNTKITVLPGCGFIRRDFTNLSMLENKGRSGTGIVTKNLHIEGGIWNGNGFRGTEKQTHDTVNNTGWTCIGRMSGLQDCSFTNMTFRNSRTIIFYINNFKNVHATKLKFESVYGADANGDGFKTNGPFTGLFVNGLSGRTFDDIISICSNDVWQRTNPTGTFADGTSFDPSASVGDCEDWHVNDLQFLDSAMGIRILSTTGRISDGTFSNIRGKTRKQWLITSNYEDDVTAINSDTSTDYRGGNIGNLTFDNIDVEIIEAGYKGCYAQLNCKIESVTFNNYTRTNFALPNYDLVRVDSNASIGQLKVNGLIIKPKTAGVTNLVNVTGGTVGAIKVTDAQIDRTGRTIADMPVVKQSGGTVGRITLNGVEADNINNLVDLVDGTMPTINACAIVHTGTGSNYGTFKIATGKTVADCVLSNYAGKSRIIGGGTITSQRGDGFTGALIP